MLHKAVAACLHFLLLGIQEQTDCQPLGHSLSISLAEGSNRFGAFPSHLMTKSESRLSNLELQLRIR